MKNEEMEKTIEIVIWRCQVTAVKNLPKGWKYHITNEPAAIGQNELLSEEKVIG